MNERRRRLARLIMPGWRGGSARRLRRLLADCPAGGLLLFSWGTTKDAARLVRRLPAGMLVACDVEEGPAQRFPDAVRHPSAMAVGATGDPRLAFRQGRAIALAAANVGRTAWPTDGLPGDWAARCNVLDEIWVPSEFNRETFAAAGVEPAHEAGGKGAAGKAGKREG